MFISQYSGKQFGPGISPVRVVTKKRAVSFLTFEGERGRGWEIAQEMAVAPEEVAEVQAKYEGNWEPEPKTVELKVKRERRERKRDF